MLKEPFVSEVSRINQLLLVFVIHLHLTTYKLLNYTLVLLCTKVLGRVSLKLAS